jgi:HlyD family secretion protein
MKTIVNPKPAELAGLIESSGARAGRVRLLLILAAVIIVAVVIWGARARGAATAAPDYVTEAITRGDLSLTITATGTLQPTNKVTVGSEISGLVKEVLVQANDRVARGQPLARIDATKLTLQAQSARATVRSAEARVQQAEATVRQSASTLARQQELRALSGGRLPSAADLETSTAAVDRARADLASAQAAVAEAQASLQVLESDLEKTVIRSPIDGLVLTRSVEPGQTVAAAFAAPELFVIAESLDRLKLTVSIAEADVGHLAVDQPAAFTVDAWPQRTYAAAVAKVAFGSSVTDNVVTYRSELQVANPDLSLRPGMTATVDIRVAERKQVLLVPTPALRYAPPVADARDEAAKKSLVQSLVPLPPRGAATPTVAPEKSAPGQSRLWVLRTGAPQPVVVRTGLSDGRMTEVSGDSLAAGDRVILRLNRPTP